MAKVGREGTITVAEGKALHHALEVVEGLRFDRGYLSPYFITNAKEQKVELDAPYILIVDKRLSQVQQLVPALEFVLQNQAALLIVAEDVERYCVVLSGILTMGVSPALVTAESIEMPSLCAQ